MTVIYPTCRESMARYEFLWKSLTTWNDLKDDGSGVNGEFAPRWRRGSPYRRANEADPFQIVSKAYIGIYIAYTFTDADIHKCLSFMAIDACLVPVPRKGRGSCWVLPWFLPSLLARRGHSLDANSSQLGQTAEDGGVGRWREGGGKTKERNEGAERKSDRATVTGGAWCQMIGSEAQCQQQRVLPCLTATFKLRANWEATQKWCSGKRLELLQSRYIYIYDMSNKSGNVLKAFLL